MSVQIFLPAQKDGQAQQHADTRGAKTIFPAKSFAQVTADKAGEQGADVDAGIEKGKS